MQGSTEKGKRVMKPHLVLSTTVTAVVALPLLLMSALPVSASHSWANYHWARTSNPFTLKLGDNVSSTWDPYLRTASSDWSESSVLDTVVVAGGTKPSSCRPTSGRVEVCNARYGWTGYLGLAQVWVYADGHIAYGVTKMNDTYFNTSTYNKPAWRQYVMCQEIGHTFGLGHQDEDYNNASLGSCMDYSNPESDVRTQHPNAHDYAQLELIYGGHLDSTTTVSMLTPGRAGGTGEPGDSPAEWGRPVRFGRDGRPILYRRDLDRGQHVYTWVFWAPGPAREQP